MKDFKLYFILFVILAFATTFKLNAQNIKVATAQAFVDKIKSNTTLELSSQKIVLSNISKTSNSNIELTKVYGSTGSEIHIKNVNNLTITGEDFFTKNTASHPELVTEPTYGNVLVFYNCKNITLKYIRAGHGPEKGECLGGVFRFENCTNVNVENSILYGSGTYGITANNVDKLNCTKTTIKECTYGIVDFTKVENFTFTECFFKNNQGYDMITANNCSGSFINTRISQNKTDNGHLFMLTNSRIVLDAVTLEKNTFKSGLCNNWDNFSEIDFFGFASDNFGGKLFDKILSQRTKNRQDLIQKWNIVSFKPYSQTKQIIPKTPLIMEFTSSGKILFTGKGSESFPNYLWHPIDEEHLLISIKNDESVYNMISKIYKKNEVVSFDIVLNDLIEFTIKPVKGVIVVDKQTDKNITPKSSAAHIDDKIGKAVPDNNLANYIRTYSSYQYFTTEGKLTILKFSDKNINSLPENMDLLTDLEELDISSNNFTKIPAVIFKISSLQKLIISKNSISNMPPSISQLINLTSIKAAENKLSEIPKEVGNLKKIRILDFSKNKISSIPESIGELNAALYDLNVSENQITELPNTLGNCTKITQLNLAYNNLNIIPENIGNLKKMKIFKLNNNNLKTVPSGIGNMQKLKKLWIENNQIEYLPKSLIKLNDLKELGKAKSYKRTRDEKKNTEAFIKRASGVELR